MPRPAEDLSRIAAAALGWPQGRRQQELRRFHQGADRIHPAMTPASSALRRTG
nr:hypothetical protein [Paracoccus shandongensis]